jgi:hemerythrin superfamily protein
MDIYQVLMSDHDQIRPLLDELVETSKHDSTTRQLLTEISDLLITHSRAEEAVFYAFLKGTDEGSYMVGHNYREHLNTEATLKFLLDMETVNNDWTAAAKSLRKIVLHHIAEEESLFFEVARQAFIEEDAFMLADAFAKAKERFRSGIVRNVPQAS